MRPLVLALTGLASAPVHAADLQPKTVDRLRAVCVSDRTPPGQGRGAVPLGRCAAGNSSGARQSRHSGAGSSSSSRSSHARRGRSVDIPDGLVHHWIGVVFAPGVSIEQAVALLQDYDRHADIYKPNVARSKLVSRDGDRFKVYLRFFMKKGITVVVTATTTR